MSIQPPLSLSAWLRLDLVERCLPSRSGVSLLEIGAGGGALAARLARRFDYTGVEPDPDSWELAAARVRDVGQGSVVHGDLDALPADQRFDVVCAFEVLEHIEDDGAALRAWVDRLRPGGSLVLSVPAFEARFGPWDEKVGHFRRYERAGLEVLLADAGLADVNVRAYGFPITLLTERARNAVARRGHGRVDASMEQRTASMEQRTASSGRQLQPSGRTAWLTWLGALPFRAAQRPFVHRDLGTGFVACGRLAA